VKPKAPFRRQEGGSKIKGDNTYVNKCIEMVCQDKLPTFIKNKDNGMFGGQQKLRAGGPQNFPT